VARFFTRLIKEISIAPKTAAILTLIQIAGRDRGQPKPRYPADNIKRLSSAARANCGRDIRRILAGGLRPGGVAVLLDINTDNRNRTVSEIRHVFVKIAAHG